MLLETDFTVGAPADRVFAELLDIEQLSACLPGSAMSRVDGDEALQGELRPQLGGSTVSCLATMRPVDVDEDAHSASCVLRVRQAEGPGFATGLLRARVDGGGSNGDARVRMTLDGRLVATAISEDDARGEAERLLGELAANLRRSLAERASRPAAKPAAPAPPRPAVAPSPQIPAPRAPEAAAPAASQLPAPAVAGAAGAAGLLALLIGLLLGRRARRRGVWFEIRYRW